MREEEALERLVDQGFFTRGKGDELIPTAKGEKLISRFREEQPEEYAAWVKDCAMNDPLRWAHLWGPMQ